MKIIKKYKDIFAILIICFLTILFFSRVIFLPDTYMIPWDSFDQQYSWLNDLIYGIRNGEFPMWSNSYFSGFPSIADPQQGCFYPFNLILTIFANSETNTISYYPIEMMEIFHFALIGIFTYYMIKELKISSMAALIGAICFEFCGYVIAHPEHYSTIMSLTWIPFSIRYLIRFKKEQRFSNFAGFIIGLLLCILGGHTQTTLYGGVLILILMCVFFINLWQKEGKKKAATFIISIGIALIITVMLASIQLLPTWELMNQSTREKMQYETFLSSSGNPISIVSIFLPKAIDLENIKNQTSIVETYYYFGILPIIFLIMVILSRNTKEKKKKIILWIALAILFYMLSLGKHTFLNKILYQIPLLNKLQRTVNFMFNASLCISIAVAYAVDIILQKSEYKLKIKSSLCCIEILVLMTLLYLVFKGIAEDSNQYIYLLKNIIFICIVLISFYIFYLLYQEGKLNRLQFAIICIIICFIDIFLSSYTQQFACNLYNKELVYYYSSEEGKKIKNILNKTEERTANMTYLNIGSILRNNDILGYNPLKLKKYEKYMQNLGNMLEPEQYNKIDEESKLLDLLSVKYIVKKVNTTKTENTIIYENKNIKIYENKNAEPMYYFTKKIKNIENDDLILEKIKNKDYIPQEIVYTTEKTTKDYKISENDTVELIEKTNNKIILKTVNENEAYLSTSEIMYPGWKVKINGEEGKIDTVNTIFRGIELPQGENYIELYFLPDSFIIGKNISIIGFIIFLSIFAFREKIEKVLL